jgi:hypothetical protein
VERRDPRELGGHWRTAQRIAVFEPGPDLEPWVERIWTASWEYDEPYAQKIVPLPQVHVSVIGGDTERSGAAAPEAGHGRPRVVGPHSRHMVRELAGRGSVVGAAFRPGVFRVLAGEPVSRLVDRELDADDVPGLAGETDRSGEMAGWLRARRRRGRGPRRGRRASSSRTSPPTRRSPGSTGSPRPPGWACGPCSACSPSTSVPDRSG